MNRTDATPPSPPLIVLGDQDASLCADGACGAQPAETFLHALRTAHAAEDATAR